MEMTDIIQNGGLILSGAAVTKLVGLAVKAWAARNGKTEVANDPLNVNMLDSYVTRDEFKDAMERNDADHENIFARLSRNDREYGEIKGLLTGLSSDIQLIKEKLLKTR